MKNKETGSVFAQLWKRLLMEMLLFVLREKNHLLLQTGRHFTDLLI